MHMELVYSSTTTPMARPENEGYDLDTIRVLFEQMQGDGHTVQLVDTASMIEGDRYRIYLSEAVPAAGNRYKVGRPFGSNAHKGQDLGDHVPALFASKGRGEPPSDVYPHETREGAIVTIADYVSELSA
jgi:hypothetical protein